MTGARDIAQADSLGYGEQVKRYRLAEGLSVPQLAARAGIHPQALRRIESGTTAVPQAATRTQIARALGLSEQQWEQLERMVQRSPSSGPGPVVPFVGRSEELRLLRHHLDASGPPLLLLYGEPGIGKTELLTQGAMLGIERGMRVLRGSCSRWSGQQSPYSPLSDALQSALQRPHARVKRDLMGCEWLSLLLPQLLDTPYNLPRCHALPGQEGRLIAQAARRFLLQSAGKRGTLLLLDDLQWAGGDTLALLDDLLRDAPVDRFRVIGAYRENEVLPGSPFSTILSDLGHAGLVVQYPIGGLNDADAERLLDTVLQEAGDLAVPHRPKIVQRSDGVPFFLVSWALSLREGIDQGGVAPQLPWTIAQSIRQRVASLSQAAQGILAAIALIGRTDLSVLSALFGMSIDELVLPLEEAQRARLIGETQPSGYAVEHEVIREVIEADLSVARRAALHLQIAEVLEGERPGGLQARPAEIAWHFLQAGMPGRALPYLLGAGDEAEAVFAHREAERHYEQVRTLAARLGNRAIEAEAQEKLGAVWTATGRYPQALDALERAIQLHRQHSNREAEARVTARLSRLLALAGMPHEGRVRAEALIALVGDDASLESLAQLQAARAECLQREGEHALQLEAAESAIEHATQIRDDGLLAEMFARQGIALQMLGQLPQGRLVLSEAIPRLERMANLDILSNALRELGWICLSMGDFDEGLAHRQQAVQVAETLQDPVRIAVELANLAMAEIVGGFWREAGDHLRRAIGLARSLGTPPSTMYVLFVAGVLELIRGVDWPQADAYLGECGAMAMQAGDIAMAWQVQWALAERDLFIGNAEVALQRFTHFGGVKRYREMNATDAPYLLRVSAALNAAVGRLDDAAGLINLAIRGSEEEQDQLHLVEAFRVAAQISAARGDLDEAAFLLARARALGAQTHYRFGEGRALHGLGLVRAVQGDVAPARAHLAEASLIFYELGATKNRERADEPLHELGRTGSLDSQVWLAGLQRV